MKDYSHMQTQYMARTYINRGLTFVKGDGAYLFTEGGERYLDLMTSYGVQIFGHAHPEICRVLAKQLKTLSCLHGSFVSDVRAQASRALVTRCGSGYAQVYWGNSGAEAVEAALKFSVLRNGRKKFVTAFGGYHGKTLGALSATDAKKYRNPFEPLLWEFVSHDYGNIEKLTAAIDEQTAAVIIEPIQGESGIIQPRDGYLKAARDVCTKTGALLILDEIQTGAGRTGTFLAGEQSGVQADICCLGKGLAAGLPIGATVVTEYVAATISRGIHTSTFGGNPLVCAGVLITLKLLADSVLHHVRDIGKYFRDEIQRIQSSRIVSVRGNGLMIGMDVSHDRDGVLKQLQKEHILAIPAGDSVVRFLPPYIVTKEQIDQTIEILKKIVV